MNFKAKYLLSREDYGELAVLIEDSDITDINWNGHELWVDNLKKGRYKEGFKLSDAFVERFSSLLASVSSRPYNRNSPVLEVETSELRISIIHPSVAHTGATISIRKTPAIRRLEKKSMIADGYCTEGINYFLSNCIKAKCNIAVIGLPGAGKTELLKYLTKYIPAAERVITIEDNLEIHYRSINPEKDGVELKVSPVFTYTDAIKACLRQLPKWIILSEARSVEVRYLLEVLSAGTQGLTTLHTDDVRNIPDRIKNMSEANNNSDHILNNAYALIDIGVLVKRIITPIGITRKIDQICIFDRGGQNASGYRNSITMVLDQGELVVNQVSQFPYHFLKKMTEHGIVNPFAQKKKLEH